MAHSFCLNGPYPASFLFFSQRNDKYITSLTINDKSIEEMLGTRTGGEWKVQTKPLSYDGSPIKWPIIAVSD